MLLGELEVTEAFMFHYSVSLGANRAVWDQSDRPVDRAAAESEDAGRDSNGISKLPLINLFLPYKIGCN